MSDYSLRIKVQNGRIRAAMAVAGVKNASELARLSNTNQSLLGDFLNLKKPARNKRTGQWSNVAIRIAEALNTFPEDLFTETQQVAALITNTGEIGISEEQAKALAYRLEVPLIEYSKAEEEIEQAQVHDILDEVMRVLLTPREMAVVNARKDGETLGDIAEKHNISRTRASDIEQTAFRKLRAAASNGRGLTNHPRLVQGMIDLVEDLA